MPNAQIVISSIISYILGLCITFIFGLLSLPLLPFRKTLPIVFLARFIRPWSLFNSYFLKKTCRLSYKIHGQQHLESLEKKEGNYVVISNHQSAWETMSYLEIFHKVTYVLKKDLLMVPFFGWGLALLNPVAIDRNKRQNAIKKLINEGQKRIKRGYVFIAFPEGTRQTPGSIGSYSLGAIKMAQLAKVNLLPVVHNAGNFWKRRSLWKHPGIIHVVIGRPIDCSLYDVRQLTQSIEQWSQKQLDQILSGDPITEILLTLPEKKPND